MSGNRSPFPFSDLATCARVGTGLVVHGHWRGEFTTHHTPLTLCDRQASEIAGDFALRIGLPFDICERCERVWRELNRGSA
jgi:hypothetical protein